MSRYSILLKAMYLDKLKRLMVWNEGSSSHAQLNSTKASSSLLARTTHNKLYDPLQHIVMFASHILHELFIYVLFLSSLFGDQTNSFLRFLLEIELFRY